MLGCAPRGSAPAGPLGLPNPGCATQQVQTRDDTRRLKKTRSKGRRPRSGERSETMFRTTETMSRHSRRRRKKKLKENGVIFLSFAVSTAQMGNKIFKMLKMNFDNEPKILTRNHKTDDKNFIEGIYSFVVSNKNLSLDLSKSNFIETNIFKDKKTIFYCLSNTRKKLLIIAS